MIFALWDYISFRKQTGPYDRATGTNPMCGAYVGEPPEEILLLLEEGDPILVANFGWWVSWLIMYLTNSHISHVAVYVGGGKIMHATLQGGEVAPIARLFGPKVRLLAGKAPIPPERRNPMAWKTADRFHAGRRYSVMLVVCKGLLIIFGRDPRCFRWRLSADICVAIALVVAATRVSVYWYLLALVYLAIVVVNKMRRPPRRSSKFANFYGVPSDLLLWLLRDGAFMPDPMAPWSQRAVACPNSPWSATILRRKPQSKPADTRLS